MCKTPDILALPGALQQKEKNLAYITWKSFSVATILPYQ